MATQQETLFITDTSPLITLAKAGEIDVLLAQPLPVQIPDAVYREAVTQNTRTARTLRTG